MQLPDKPNLKNCLKIAKFQFLHVSTAILCNLTYSYIEVDPFLLHCKSFKKSSTYLMDLSIQAQKNPSFLSFSPNPHLDQLQVAFSSFSMSCCNNIQKYQRNKERKLFKLCRTEVSTTPKNPTWRSTNLVQPHFGFMQLKQCCMQLTQLRLQFMQFRQQFKQL